MTKRKINRKVIEIEVEHRGKKVKMKMPFFAVVLEDWFTYYASIDDIAKQFYMAPEDVIENLLTVAPNKKARDYLYLKYYRKLKDEGNEITQKGMEEFIEFATDPPLVFSDRFGKDTIAAEKIYQFESWELSVKDVKVILLPFIGRAEAFVNKHNKQLIKTKRRNELDALVEKAMELRKEFIEHRNKANNLLAEQTRQIQTAQYIKHLVEVDEDKENYKKLVGTRYQTDLENYKEKIDRLTKESDKKCRALVTFLRSKNFTDQMSDRRIYEDWEVAETMEKLTEGIQVVPSGAEYLREDVGKSLIEGSEKDPLWYRLHEPGISYIIENTKDKRAFFKSLRKTNGAIIKILSYWAYCVKDHVTWVPTLNSFFEIRQIDLLLKVESVALFSKTGQVIGEVNIQQVATTEKMVKVIDMEPRHADTFPKKAAGILNKAQLFLQVVNCLIVAYDISDKLETGVWDAVKAANALAGFGSAAIKLEGASKMFGWSKFVTVEAARGLLGVVGGGTQAAMAYHDFNSDMASMNAGMAFGDMLLGGGGMLMAGGATFSWAAGVSTILIPIGAIISAVGAIIKFIYTPDAKEAYIRATTYFLQWESLEVNKRYMLVRSGVSVDYPRDEFGLAELKQWYYGLQVELAGDHGTSEYPIVAAVKIIDKKTGGEKLEYEDEIQIVHSMGRVPIGRNIRANWDIKEDIQVQVQIHIVGVPGSALSERFELGHFDDWLLGELD